VLLAIKDAIVKQRTPKKQPTRNDLAQAWKIIRDQSEIIELQAKIRRQDRLSRTDSKDSRSLRQLKKSQSKKRVSPSQYVN
jgi:hypothetical protein